MRIRRLLIRTLNPLIWKISNRRKLAAIQEFSDTELDSGWQSLYALRHMKDPKVKAALFHHALEEFYHADLFAQLQSSYAEAPLNKPVFSRQALLDDLKDEESLLDFLVEVYVGEQEINGDFMAYANAPVDEAIRGLFLRIKKEEESHEELSRELLLKFSGGEESSLQWLIVKKRWQFTYKRYTKFMQGTGRLMLYLWLGALYFGLGLFFVSSLRRRLRFGRKTQSKIFREQAMELAAQGPRS